MSAAKPGYIPDALDAIRQVRSNLDREASRERIPMWQAVRHVARALGSPDRKCDFEDALDAIRQAATDGKVEIWGRREVAPAAEPIRAADDWTPINPLYWRTHRISAMATFETKENDVHSASEPLIIGEHNQHWSLQVVRSDLERLWPRK